MSKMVGENGKNFPPAKLAEGEKKIILIFKFARAKNEFRFGGIPHFQKMGGKFKKGSKNGSKKWMFRLNFGTNYKEITYLFKIRLQFWQVFQ